MKRIQPIEQSNVEIGDLRLESGIVLNNVVVAFERVGPRDAPVILVCHALTGNQYAVGSPENEGWWSGLIGSDKYIDTSTYQIITTNVIGGCNGTTGPNSIDANTDKPYKGRFPFITVRDMVHAQYRALQRLGIVELHAVIGGSLGGMQVLEWGLLYPTYMKLLIPIAVTPYFIDYAIGFNTLGRLAIIQDPAWQNGEYSDENPPVHGLSLARIAGMLTYRSGELFDKRFSRSQKADFGISHDEITYQVESYLTYQGNKLTKRFDANSYLYLLKAMDGHDIGRNRGGWEKAVQNYQATIHAIGFKHDLLYPPNMIETFISQCKKMNKEAYFTEVDTIFGHDGFLTEYEKWGTIIKGDLDGKH